jgi:cephalosporin-C deacetylase
MPSKKIKLSFFLLFFLSSFLLFAQPIEKLVKIVVTPDHANWVYKPGEAARFQVTVMKNSEPVQNVKIKYEVGPEMMTPVNRDCVAKFRLWLMASSMKTWQLPLIRLNK